MKKFDIFLIITLTSLILTCTATEDPVKLQKEKETLSKCVRSEHLVGQLPWAPGEEPLSDSYAGYIDIRSFETNEGQGNASLFYWFFPAQKPLRKNSPLIIWLQGGPGSSSMIGLFYEVGPFSVTPNMTLIRNPHTWNENYGMLFIDQPAGAGYSYVEPQHQDNLFKNGYTNSDNIHSRRFSHNNYMIQQKVFTSNNFVNSYEDDYLDGYVVNQKGVTKDLIVFLRKFYRRYPEQKQSDLYIAGESYAGKYVPSLASAIHHHNIFARSIGAHHNIFPLAGIAVASGLTDPITQIKTHGTYAFQLGLVSNSDAEYLDNLVAQAIKQIKDQEYVAATDTRNKLFEYFKNVTGDVNVYDVRKKDEQNDWSLMEKFMNLPEIKKSINVGSRVYYKDLSVIEYLKGDIMKSTALLFPTLIENYKVMLLQGNMDFRDGVGGNTEWLYSLEFDGAEAFRKKKRKIWRFNGHLTGYVVQHQNLTRAIVLQAGHLIPKDQPAASLDIITRFIENVQF